MSLFQKTPLASAVAALKQDLLDENGPRISTMRNYRFAILAYHPTDEFRLRAHVHDLVTELHGGGWNVLPVDLHAVLLDRVRSLGDDVVARLVAAEKSLADHPERALKVLGDRLAHLVEGPNGLAADISRIVTAFAALHPGEAERSLVLLGRAGALYPFFRYSSLLKHLDGRTAGLPVVLLYPGTVHDGDGLSFMDVLPPDRDYRPRIYA